MHLNRNAEHWWISGCCFCKNVTFKYQLVLSSNEMSSFSHYLFNAIKWYNVQSANARLMYSQSIKQFCRFICIKTSVQFSISFNL